MRLHRRRENLVQRALVTGVAVRGVVQEVPGRSRTVGCASLAYGVPHAASSSV